MGGKCTPFPSDNFGERRGCNRPDMIVLHYTAMDTADEALERLCSDQHEVSAHYLISEKGEVFQLVAEESRAWHAGAGTWGNVCDVNSHSIGIELANTGFTPFPEAQMMALESLLSDVMQRWDIAPERIIGHSDMAPNRKGDPGARFDWRRLALLGLSVWPDDQGGEGDFRSSLTAFGYPADATDQELLSAFRLRFCPWKSGWKSGAPDKDDLKRAQGLARYPVDPRLGKT